MNFNEDALSWLKKNGFKNEEIDAAKRALSIAWKHIKAGKEDTLMLPKGTSKKVAALVYSVVSESDMKGRPLGFEKSGFVSITEGARRRFNEESELGEYESVIERMSKIKLGRGLSDPKKRTSVKK